MPAKSLPLISPQLNRKSPSPQNARRAAPSSACPLDFHPEYVVGARAKPAFIKFCARRPVIRHNSNPSASHNPAAPPGYPARGQIFINSTTVRPPFGIGFTVVQPSPFGLVQAMRIQGRPPPFSSAAPPIPTTKSILHPGSAFVPCSVTHFRWRQSPGPAANNLFRLAPATQFSASGHNFLSSFGRPWQGKPTLLRHVRLYCAVPRATRQKLILAPSKGAGFGGRRAYTFGYHKNASGTLPWKPSTITINFCRRAGWTPRPSQGLKEYGTSTGHPIAPPLARHI